MPIAVLFCYAVIQIGLVVYSFQWGGQRNLRLWLLRAMLLAMAYDNLMVSMGPWLIENDVYFWLNYPRFFFHAALLPFLTIFVLSIMKAAEVELASKRWFIGACWLVTAATWCYGVGEVLVGIDLQAIETMGYMRLSAVDKAPPLGAIVTNLVIVPLSALVWKKAGWSWMFLSSLFIMLVNFSAAGAEWSFLAGNGAEVVFMLSLLLTDKRFQRI